MGGTDNTIPIGRLTPKNLTDVTYTAGDYEVGINKEDGITIMQNSNFRLPLNYVPEDRTDIHETKTIRLPNGVVVAVVQWPTKDNQLDSVGAEKQVKIFDNGIETVLTPVSGGTDPNGTQIMPGTIYGGSATNNKDGQTYDSDLAGVERSPDFSDWKSDGGELLVPHVVPSTQTASAPADTSAPAADAGAPASE